MQLGIHRVLQMYIKVEIMLVKMPLMWKKV